MIYAPDSLSLKPGSGATKEVLDKGVSGQPDYILWPDYWTMKVQVSRPISDPIQKELEGPTKDRPAY